MGLWLNRGARDGRTEADLVLRVARICNDPFEPSTVAVRKIFRARKRHRLSGGDVHHFKRIGVKHTGTATFADDLPAVDGRVHRHVALGQRRSDLDAHMVQRLAPGSAQ